MQEFDNLLSESRAGKKNLANALDERDKNATFNRCMVGGESCKATAINAHCIPETMLELIMDESREVRARHSEPPKTPMQWFNEEPLKPMPIGKFNAGRWSCRQHDDIFSPLDTKRLEGLTERTTFLLIYKIAVYLAQRLLHTGERLATPILDPATQTPEGLSDQARGYLKEVARKLSEAAMRTLYMKWQLDKMLNDEVYDKIEYRVAMWATTPTMAAVGMAWRSGPGDRADWYGENSSIPVWIGLLPQDHGQTIVTASPKGAEKYTRDIHEGIPSNRAERVRRGNNWTGLVCRKVLANATDIAVSNESFSQVSKHERRALRQCLLSRSARQSRKRKRALPNLLSIR